ncbi:MAG: putative toxin-antitoxin system toxin component, PIN family [Candidatus Limnocylindria bacterium]
MRVLLDTNVLVSALLFGGLPRELLQRALRGEVEVVTSVRLMAEFEEVLVERFGLAPEIAQAARSEYEQLAALVRPRRVPRIARDPDDNEVLAAAAMGRADFIVTGDRDLLALERHGGRPILSPRQFEERSKGEAES